MRLSASLGPLTDRDDRFPFPLYTSSSKSQFLLNKAIPSDDSFRYRPRKGVSPGNERSRIYFFDLSLKTRANLPINSKGSSSLTMAPRIK